MNTAAADAGYDTVAGAALCLAAWLLIPADGDGQSAATAWLAGRRYR
jgi:hypothetical protein